jgi:hypothetical protein
VGRGSSLHCLFAEEKMRSCTSERVAGMNFRSFGGSVVGNSNWYGSVHTNLNFRSHDGMNLVRMRSILSLKKSRKVLARAGVSGLSGRVVVGVRLRMVFRVFQRDRGLDEDSVTRLVMNSDLALLINLRTNLH